MVALGVVLLGVLLLIGTNQIATSGMNTVVGPKVFPLIVSFGTLGLGVLLTIGALRGHRAEPATEEDTDPNAPVNLASPGLILGGFLLGTLLLQPLGFVFGTAVMYFTVAFAFGERRYGLIAGVALIVALITYLLFTRGLGLTLPPGILKGIL
ncbi:tripartite tricarboxylate transporter TctB family protein [Deinococcus sp. Arct2-2]|nr:tripartite tricarboxylate transporter TctB family protein [Deinococcus sp. Arct2-2]